jgi:hypothetical protein
VEIDLQSDEETEEEREERIRMMQKPARHVMEKKYDRTHVSLSDLTWVLVSFGDCVVCRRNVLLLYYASYMF